MTETSNAMPIQIRHWLDGRVLFESATASSVKEAVEEAVRNGASLVGAHLDRASLVGASLDGAHLVGAPIIAVAMVQFTDHCECGRMLIAIKTATAVHLLCGCFAGTEPELRAYIASGSAYLRRTRTLALDTVLMLLDAKNDEAQP